MFHQVWVRTDNSTNGHEVKYVLFGIMQNIRPDPDPNHSINRHCFDDDTYFVNFTAYAACETSNICCENQEDRFIKHVSIQLLKVKVTYLIFVPMFQFLGPF